MAWSVTIREPDEDPIPVVRVYCRVSQGRCVIPVFTWVEHEYDRVAVAREDAWTLFQFLQNHAAPEFLRALQEELDLALGRRRG